MERTTKKTDKIKNMCLGIAQFSLFSWTIVIWIEYSGNISDLMLEFVSEPASEA
jgi:hypothetical protein